MACQGLSGPFIAKRRHCDVVEWEPSIASEADLAMKLGSRGFPISASLGCAPSSRVRIIQTANYSKRVPRKSSRKQKSTFEILYFISLIFNSQNILLGCCFISSFHFSNGHSRVDAASAGEFSGLSAGPRGSLTFPEFALLVPFTCCIRLVLPKRPVRRLA